MRLWTSWFLCVCLPDSLIPAAKSAQVAYKATEDQIGGVEPRPDPCRPRKAVEVSLSLAAWWFFQIPR